MIRFNYNKGNRHEEIKYDLYTQRFYLNGYKSIETKPVGEKLEPSNDCPHIEGTTDKPVKVQFVKYNRHGSFFLINGESRVIPNDSNWRSCQTGRIWR